MNKTSVVADTFEKLGELAKDSAKAVVSEPAKVLENALGGNDSMGEEQGTGGSQQTNQTKSNQADPLIVRKRQEDQERTQKLLSLHRERLKEEEAYQERTVTEDEREEEIEEQEKEVERQKEIVQLQKQDAKDAVLNTPTSATGVSFGGPMAAAKKKMGTMELGRQKD